MQIKNYNNQDASNPEKIAKIFHAILDAEDFNDLDKEHFWVVGLNNLNQIKFIELVSLGTHTSSLVCPTCVFRLAIHQGVNRIIVAHNHPSGDLRASDDDVKITERLIESGKILNVKVLDHLIITKNNFKSFVQHSICDFNPKEV